MAITPYYLALMDLADPADALWRQAVPDPAELRPRLRGEGDDPLGEEKDSPVPGLTHRYPDRVLMVVAGGCAVLCRHCLRKRIFSCRPAPSTEAKDAGTARAVPSRAIDKMVSYVAATPSVREVILSGGDPFTLGTRRLERLLAKLRGIEHLEVIRIGTRTPVTLPQRIDADLCAMLERYHPVWVNVHFNHPRECTPEAAAACDRLLRAGIPLNNQTVLLRGVNDDLEVMRRLCRALMMLRVKPYYLFQADPVTGTAHLRTTVAAGQAIAAGLRGHLSGLAVPLYTLDAPGGGGKVPGERSGIVSYDEERGEVVMRNYQGERYIYYDPEGERAG